MLTSISVFCWRRDRGDDEEEEDDDNDEIAAALTAALATASICCSLLPLLRLLATVSVDDVSSRFALRQYGHCCGESQRHSFAPEPSVSGASPSYARKAFFHTTRRSGSALML